MYKNRGPTYTLQPFEFARDRKILMSHPAGDEDDRDHKGKQKMKGAADDK